MQRFLVQTRPLALALSAAVALVACGGANPQDPEARASNLDGQVSTGSTNSAGTHYSASRFLEQASMGPTPDAVARVRALGFPAWINEQVAKPITRIVTPTDLINFDQINDRTRNDRAWSLHTNSLFDTAVGADDQLRVRVAWVLSNFLVTSTRKVNAYGGSEYWNTLMQGAFGRYGDLLKAITLSPAMGHYLDNNQNRRDSLNENYGRELMQLFSVGMVMLNPDGSVKRDALGKPIETYSQKDVIEITRALTGWDFVPLTQSEQVMNNHNFANYGKAMAVRFSGNHDTDAKVVLGKIIPAGGDAAKDLNAVVDILMAHPNTAPFVSLRLIQGLTTSDPSPAYLKRVSAVFEQTRGDLAAVIKAILLDAEARAGDVPGKGAGNFGRIREPYLLHTMVLRGMGCRLAVRQKDRPNDVDFWSDQRPLQAESVFNFYPPNHRAPGSNLLAPEQKTLLSREFSRRLGRYNWAWQDESVLSGVGCDVETFKKAIAKSDDALLDLMSERYFRGAMPATVRQGLKDGVAGQSWQRNSPTQLLGFMVQFASMTPPMGAVK
jgi:uncharacterized protein (DUF1800 family)